MNDTKETKLLTDSWMGNIIYYNEDLLPNFSNDKQTRSEIMIIQKLAKYTTWSINMKKIYRAILLVFCNSSLILISHSLLLAQWQPDYRLTTNDSLSVTNINNAWCIANGTNNDVHVVWFDKREGNCAIYYKRSLDNGFTWSADMRLSFTTDSSIYPAVAVGDSVIHVIWLESPFYLAEVHYKHSFDCGTTWGPDTTFGFYVPSYNNACISASGRFVSIAWTHGSSSIGCICSQDYGVTWSSGTLLTGLDFPSVAVHDSEVHVVRNSPNRYYLLYNKSTDCGATWLPMDTISSGNDIRTPSIAVSEPDSIIHIVWRDNQGGWVTKYIRSTNGGSTWPVEAVLGQGIYPSITCIDNNVYVIWDGRVGLLYRWSSDFGVTWSAETLLTTPLGGNFPYPSIDCTDSLVNIVWRDARDGNSEIYYKRNPTGSVSVYEKHISTNKQQLKITVLTFIRNIIFVKFNESLTGCVQLKLYNAYGSCVWQKQIRCNGQNIAVMDNTIAGLPMAIYFLSIKYDSDTGPAKKYKTVKIKY